MNAQKLQIDRAKAIGKSANRAFRIPLGTKIKLGATMLFLYFASKLIAEPICSKDSPQDRKGKQPAVEVQNQNDSAIIKSAMKKYADNALQRNVVVSFNQVFSVNVVFNSPAYLPITDPKTDNTVVRLSPEEQKNLEAGGMVKPMGRPYLLILVKGADGANKVYVYELKHTDIKQAKPDSVKTQ